MIWPKGPKYRHSTKYGFCSGSFPYGLGKYSLYGYLGLLGFRVQGSGFMRSRAAGTGSLRADPGRELPGYQEPPGPHLRQGRGLSIGLGFRV